MRLPDFIGIGGQRCGSTTIWSMMRGDDRLFLPERKELHYFTDRDGEYREDLCNYGAYFEGARGDQLVGEFTPNYLTSGGACRRIMEHLPDVRLIVTLRDPVERAISLYTYRVARGMEVRSMGRAIRADMRRCVGGEEVVDRHHAYCQLGMFSDGVARYIECFGRDSMLILTMDMLRHDAESVRARLARHLGLEGAIGRGDEGSGSGWANRSTTTPRIKRLERFAKGTLRARRGSDGLIDRVACGVARRAVALNQRAGSPRVPRGLREELRSFYKEDGLRLAALTGIALPWVDC